MEIYKIVFSLVLPGLVFSKNCGYLQTLEPYGLDVERSSSKGANVDIIAEIKSNSLAHCFEACCNATEIGDYSMAVYNNDRQECILYSCQPLELCESKHSNGLALLYIRSLNDGKTYSQLKNSANPLSRLPNYQILLNNKGKKTQIHTETIAVNDYVINSDIEEFDFRYDSDPLSTSIKIVEDFLNQDEVIKNKDNDVSSFKNDNIMNNLLHLDSIEMHKGSQNRFRRSPHEQTNLLAVNSAESNNTNGTTSDISTPHESKATEKILTTNDTTTQVNSSTERENISTTTTPNVETGKANKIKLENKTTETNSLGIDSKSFEETEQGTPADKSEETETSYHTTSTQTTIAAVTAAVPETERTTAPTKNENDSVTPSTPIKMTESTKLENGSMSITTTSTTPRDTSPTEIGVAMTDGETKLAKGSQGETSSPKTTTHAHTIIGSTAELDHNSTLSLPAETTAITGAVKSPTEAPLTTLEKQSEAVPTKVNQSADQSSATVQPQSENGETHTKIVSVNRTAQMTNTSQTESETIIRSTTTPRPSSTTVQHQLQNVVTPDQFVNVNQTVHFINTSQTTQEISINSTTTQRPSSTTVQLLQENIVTHETSSQQTEDVTNTTSATNEEPTTYVLINESSTEIANTPTTTNMTTISDVNGVSSQEGLFRYPSFDSPENAAMSAALIAAASFGIIILFSVLVLLGKRLFDSWQRRDYSRMDYLINGMYN